MASVASRAVITTCPVYVPWARPVVLMFTVTVNGVVQRLQLPGVETDSQLPPAPVPVLTVNWMLVAVLVISKVCGTGFVPAVAVAKVRVGRWMKTAGATWTLTGTVTLLPGGLNTSSPVKIPEPAPDPAGHWPRPPP